MKHNLVVFSRHPTHDALRKANLKFNKLVSIRFGSTNIGQKKYDVILNKPEAVIISSNKLLMKQAFDNANIQTANWYISDNGYEFFEYCKSEQIPLHLLPFPIVAKHIYGSRGTGNTLIKGKKSFNAWVKGKTLSNYIFEQYYNYNKEYRLHISKNGCFYTCRKMLKNDVPKGQRWYRNDSNSVWILEENPLFEKPSNWQIIIDECVKVLHKIGLDFAAFDVKVESNKNIDAAEQPKYIIIESNSAASFAERTLIEYTKEITKIINND